MGANVTEHVIGPYSHDEAVQAIQDFALALTNLGLNKRFAISPTPRVVVERELRRDNNPGRKHYSYQVVLIDKCPNEPKPEGLAVIGIRQAQAQGYKQPRVKTYEALGQRMTLSQWAKAVGVSYPTLKARIDAGMTMEEAVTQLALKKSA